MAQTWELKLFHGSRSHVKGVVQRVTFSGMAAPAQAFGWMLLGHLAHFMTFCHDFSC